MKNEFSQFGLSNEIIKALEVLGYQEPTEIQKQVIPYALADRSIAAKSQTGSGKTAAFAIPLCEHAHWEENLPEALVLEPTRELTVQVKQEIFHIGRNKRLKVPDIFGGFPIDKQIQTLKQKSHIIVGTPGRVMDHVRRESLNLSKIRYLVIDEADLMLDMGFIDEVTAIIKRLPENRVVMLFSATLSDKVQRLITNYMKDPVSVMIESETQTVELVEQKLYEMDQEDKYEAFVTLLIQENPESAMIFCGTREMVNVLDRKLKKDGIRCGMLHGEIDQQDRLRTIEGFKDGRFRYLIATDVAARGVDIQNLSHVFNYDFPTGRETYVHRIGRTGRNGEGGTAVSLVCDGDKRMLEMVEEYIGHKFEVLPLPERKEPDEKAFWQRQKERAILKVRKGAGFQKTITRLSISGGKKSKMRAVDIVGTICSIPDMTAEDIGIIDVRDSLTYVEILSGKGKLVLDALQEKTIKGKIRKVRTSRGA
ncbi:MAG: DEAD/DEAH box helicase [Hungatella sp.]